MTVEKLGHRFVSERAIYLADHTGKLLPGRNRVRMTRLPKSKRGRC